MLYSNIATVEGRVENSLSKKPRMTNEEPYNPKDCNELGRCNDMYDSLTRCSRSMCNTGWCPTRNMNKVQIIN